MKLIAIGLLACASLARAADPAQSTAPAAGMARHAEVEAQAAKSEAERCALTTVSKEGIRLLKTAGKSRSMRFDRGCEAELKAPPPAAPPVKVDFGGGSMLFDGLVKS